ncbi:hypothetical protein CDG60_06180 [Acinetobacter chinensis]|uniref:Methyltransferase n=1 Tax=Acinetobacter chinensis TaxID=2004650 RepID=A0A3B7LTZ5_9GAMM|nr:hypothetical protein [Acinetobacter chinensis]AXY56196.1 hypothetical protein CDG60_06180 [Acinetobacter chinensis]
MKKITAITALGSASLFTQSAFALTPADLTTAYADAGAEGLMDQGSLIVIGAVVFLMCIGLVIRLFKKG